MVIALSGPPEPERGWRALVVPLGIVAVAGWIFWASIRPRP